MKIAMIKNPCQTVKCGTDFFVFYLKLRISSIVILPESNKKTKYIVIDKTVIDDM